MTNSPDQEHHRHQFRAPPPSPIANASSRRSSVVNEDEISDFLEHSLHVPNLILPDQIFPKEIQVRNMPEIDFRLLISLEGETVRQFLESIAGVGCFQLVNHGVDSDLIRSVSVAAAGIFGLPPENKKSVARSHERNYGFEEVDGEEEIESSEEFVWCRDEGLKSALEGIRLQGFSNFSKEMDNLSAKIEKIANQILSTLVEHGPITLNNHTSISDKQQLHSLVCCLHKHHKHTSSEKPDQYGSLKTDFIRSLIRGSSNYSRSLCVHVCDETAEFHVYSKKSWNSFTPNKDALVVTIGDQLQAWSNGHYKTVIGRPVFKVEDEGPISMAFLYSPPTINVTQKRYCGEKEKTISLKQQLVFALFLTLLYRISIYLYKIFF